jgi:hypothetical protein
MDPQGRSSINSPPFPRWTAQKVLHAHAAYTDCAPIGDLNDHRSKTCAGGQRPDFRSEKPLDAAREAQRRHYHARVAPQLEEVIEVDPD